LYRKVAGLDQPEDKQNRTAVQNDGETPAATDIQKPAEIRSVQKKRGRFHGSRTGWGVAIILLFLGSIFFFYWPGACNNGTPHPKGAADALKTDRSTGEAGSRDGEKPSQPPIETAVAAPSVEESKDQDVTPPLVDQPKNQALATQPIEKKRQVHKAPPAAGATPEGRRKRYAIQLRAYPEDRKQNATAFLEDLRKRTPDVSMETVSIAERGVWHRILLGNFSTRKEAADYQKSNRLAREYPESFIQRKFESGP
ncbi:MAG: SPOR domain-containing protein, partial [Syntrophales bacterium]|nr:SPOR domain-containing protein [Syntrophales bacterium]